MGDPFDELLAELRRPGHEVPFDRHTIPNGAWLQWWWLEPDSTAGWRIAGPTLHPLSWMVHTDEEVETQAAAYLLLEDLEYEDAVFRNYTSRSMPDILMREFMGPPHWMGEDGDDPW